MARRPGSGRLLRGDWIELAGLALGTGILGLLLARPHGIREGGYWQLWGRRCCSSSGPACRQGLRGGTLVAATAAVVPLILVAV